MESDNDRLKPDISTQRLESMTKQLEDEFMRQVDNLMVEQSKIHHSHENDSLTSIVINDIQANKLHFLTQQQCTLRQGLPDSAQDYGADRSLPRTKPVNNFVQLKSKVFQLDDYSNKMKWTQLKQQSLVQAVNGRKLAQLTKEAERRLDTGPVAHY